MGNLQIMDRARAISRLVRTIYRSRLPIAIAEWGRKHRGDGTDPLEFVTTRTLNEIWRHLKFDREALLQTQIARVLVTRDRAKYFFAQDVVKRITNPTQQVAANTLEYNLDAAKSFPELDRPMMMINVVTSIDRVYKNKKRMDVLSIGPRSEIEIFGTQSAGFSKDRIHAIDLFSYSPFIEVGDMHAIPYPDSSFDVLLAGWVLSYSTDQGRVAREIVRVCRNQAIVAIAGDFSDGTRDRQTFSNETTHMQSCEQVLSQFSGHVKRVYFRHDPQLPEVTTVMTVFEVDKP